MCSQFLANLAVKHNTRTRRILKINIMIVSNIITNTIEYYNKIVLYDILYAEYTVQ